MQQVILVIHIILAVLMIGLILVQQGKGADAGASMGGGGAGTVFGGSGSGNFLTRLTAILTALFFITSIGLAVLAKKGTNNPYAITSNASHSQATLSETKVEENKQEAEKKLN
ncbi:preprotein translocase subunit SecG [Moraxella sp. ZY21109]